MEAPLGLLARTVALAQGDARRGTVERIEINRKMTVPYSAHNDRIRSTRVFSQQFASVGVVRITSLLLAAVSSGAVWSAALAQDAAVAPAPAATNAVVDPAASAVSANRGNETSTAQGLRHQRLANGLEHQVGL